MADVFDQIHAQAAPAGDVFDAIHAQANQQKTDTAVRDHLKDEGFLDSLWNVVKSPVAIFSDLFSGEYRKRHEADQARMAELEKNGTPEQKREFAKEVLLKNIPGASTVYKATQGNIPGALGDVAGMATLGAIHAGAEKAPEYAPAVKAGVKAAAPDVTAGATKAGAGMVASEILPGGPIKYAAGAYPVYSGVRQIGRGMGKFLDAFKENRAAGKPVEVLSTEAPETPGQIYAKQIGADWGKLSPTDQALLEHAAKAQANAAAQPPATPRQSPQVAPLPQTPPAEAPARGTSIADTLRAEMEAKRAATAEPEAEAPQPLQGGNKPKPIPLRVNGPVRPPLAQKTAPQPEAPPQPQAETPAAAEPPAPAPEAPAAPKRSLAQTEAAMAQKPAPLIDPAEARSQYTANGDRKSPALRAEEVKGLNAAQKAERWADAIEQAGLTEQILPNWRKMPTKGVSITQVQQGAMPSWEVVHEALQQKGLLGPKETAPDISIPYIIQALRNRVSQRLAAEMAK